jgi:hypothetical protein
MSDISLPRYTCEYCGRDFCELDRWQCECGERECCPACVSRVPRRHRLGDCGLDLAIEKEDD